MEYLNTLLSTLTVYRAAAKLPAVCAIRRCLDALYDPEQPAQTMLTQYAESISALLCDGANTFSDCLRTHLLYDENPFANACARGEETEAWRAAAARDIEILNELAQLDLDMLRRAMRLRAPEYAEVIDELPVCSPGTALRFDELLASYRKNGCGLFAHARAFHWEKGALTAVRNPDPIGEMIGYEWQREAVVRNTRALHEGKPCSNVLLHGDSGTGKSATIKSLLNMPEFPRLRIIEVAKNSLEELTQIQRLVSTHTQKFILYIDDLTFEQNDRSYSALKSALEGGLERRPDNVAIYVTSNRRHMVRETFTGRGSDEIHREETIQEQTSLSDRFGLRLPYLALDKPAYLSMVDMLTAKAGLDMDQEALHAMAMQWEIRHGGRTPRTATQLVAHLLSEA